MVGSEYHGGTGTEGIVSPSSSVVLRVIPAAASCGTCRLLVRSDGGRPRLAVLAVLKENAKATKGALALLVVLTKRGDDRIIAATRADGHRHRQRRGAMLFIRYDEADCRALPTCDVRPASDTTRPEMSNPSSPSSITTKSQRDQSVISPIDPDATRHQPATHKS